MAELGNKRVTIKDIASAAGVSLATVNKALTGKPKISEKRRKEIQRIAREMGYEVNSVAQVMSRKPITIGVVIPVSEEYMYFENMKEGMGNEFEHLKKYKVDAVYYIVTDDEKSKDEKNFVEWLKQNNPEAICFCPQRHSYIKRMMACVVERGIPLFLAGGGVEPPKECVTMVSVDAYLSGQMVADFFYCIHGKQVRAAVFGKSLETIIIAKKVMTFEQRLKEYGVDSPIIIEDYNDAEATRKKIEMLFKEHPEVNCIYVTDSNCIPVCEFLEEQGLTDSVALITTDFFEGMKQYVASNVIKATLRQNEREVGRITVSQAYDYLIQKKTFGKEDLQVTERVYVKPDFCLKVNLS